ncbi:hypothetical protein ABZ069_23150 [Streptomyces microflavus]
MSLLDSWRRQLARELKKRDDANARIAKLQRKIAAAEKRKE